MKTYMKPIEVIAYFKKDGFPEPLRFKWENPDSSYVSVNCRVINRRLEKFSGSNMLKYQCTGMSKEGKEERVIILKYEIATRKWYLYQM